jgi:hypothetical protein
MWPAHGATIVTQAPRRRVDFGLLKLRRRSASANARSTAHQREFAPSPTFVRAFHRANRRSRRAGILVNETADRVDAIAGALAVLALSIIGRFWES